MICANCVMAGEYNTKGWYVLAKTTHEYCGEECGCQHKTGPGLIKVSGSREPLMQTQSP